MMAQAEVIPPLRGWHGSAELHPYFVCDVFTSEPLQGNQLGVFVDGRPFDPGQMQRLAREMNFAETVFLLPPQDGGDVRMRIFTPSAELPFAGHPVLGTAFVVGTALGTDAVTLETAAGLIPIMLERSGGRITFGRMSQPIPAWEQFDRERELLDTLGVGSSQLPVELYRNGPAARLRPVGQRGRRRRAQAGHGRPGGPGGSRELLRRPRPLVEDEDVLPGRRYSRGSGHRLSRRPAGDPPGPARPRSGSASRSRSARAPRSAARRCSTPRSPATGTRSTQSRSPAWP